MKQNKNRLLAALLALLLLAALPMSAHAADSNGHWSDAYIFELEEKGWLDGVPESLTDPEATATRGLFAYLIWQALGQPLPAGECPYQDVDEEAFYRVAVTALSERGIINGYSSVSFGGEDALSREQGAVILARAFNLTPDNPQLWQSFADAALISVWAQDAISALAERGYMSGIGGNRISPKGDLKFGEAAKLQSETSKGELPGTGNMYVEVTASPDHPTSFEVTVTVLAMPEPGSEIAFVGWRKAWEGAVFTDKEDFEDITMSRQFLAKTSSWYLVYVIDSLGNITYQSTEVKIVFGEQNGIPAPVPT